MSVAVSLDPWVKGYPPCRDAPPIGTFEIGLCMAGAVSAGAYTAGVLDLLIEALDAFEAEKKVRRERGEPPLHEVRLSVLGGASAGGMCAALGAMFCDAEFPPVTPQANDATKAANPLYDAWVRRIDIRHLLGIRDLADGTLRSALDCTVLDEIVSDLIARRPSMTMRPRAWLPDRLEVLLTLANLRGVPYALRFQGATLSHLMSLHADHIRFAVVRDGVQVAARPDEVILDRFGPDPHATRELFAAATLATGAFPIALRARTLERARSDYDFRALLAPRSRLAEELVHTPDLSGLPEWARECLPDWTGAASETGVVQVPCVDGGAMDNEPLELVRRALAGWDGRNPRRGDLANRAVVLVDPFPGDRGPDLTDAPSLAALLPALFGALMNNARFKAEDLALAAAPDTYSRFLIAPSRGPAWSAPIAIASGYLGGFMGFLAEAYRHHDYMLGRRNARSFLRRHFVLPIGNPLFGRKDATPRWSDTDVARWAVAREEDGPADHLPIIPLCGRLWPGPGQDEDEIEPLPAWPDGELDPASLTRLIQLIRGRAEAATRVLYDGGAGAQLKGMLRRMVEERIAERSWLVRTASRLAYRLLDGWVERKMDAKLPNVPPRFVVEQAEKTIRKAVAELDAAR
ncbi:patatin-like phospholipase family protein [Elioraea thermophila]|uniref:patatin-like phospholipase family protein n=1 Tax=Elioraea thermophila TaxID=2185104 RepID=UPI000DF3B603|nr:patatin-like phospholipase family protein [Elioraea thermophila]